MTYVKIALLAGVVLSIAFAFFAFDQRGFDRGFNDCIVKSVNASKDTRKKQDAIRKPDNDALIDSLYNDTF